MKKKALIAIFLFGLPFLFIFFFIGCSKTSPAGSASPAGLAGPQRTVGTAFIRVDTFSLTNSDWAYNGYITFVSFHGIDSFPDRYYDLNDSLITPGILDSGLVSVFFAPDNRKLGQWAALPYQIINQQTDSFSHNIDFETFNYKVRLDYFLVPNGFVDSSCCSWVTDVKVFAIPDYKFKIVIESGTVGR
ncbi:MAG: hypothetical protein C5B59_03170 [Bacteroidetes bacterium]|nr:MAG: hypothetical protein C5B59_03170 [Bacteroidota bacterium]